MRRIQLFAYAAGSLSVVALPNDMDESGIGASFDGDVADAWSQGEGPPQDADVALAVEEPQQESQLEQLQHALELELLSSEDKAQADPYAAQLSGLINDAKPQVLALKQDSVDLHINHLQQEVESLESMQQNLDFAEQTLSHVSKEHSLISEDTAGAESEPLPLGTMVEAFGLDNLDIDGLQGMVVSGEAGDLTTVDFGDAGGIHKVDPAHLKVVQQSSLTADGVLRGDSLLSQHMVVGAAAEPLPLGTMVEAFGLSDSDIDGLQGMVVSGEGDLTTVDFGDACGLRTVDPANLKVVQESPLAADGTLRSTSLASLDTGAGDTTKRLPAGSVVEAHGFKSLLGEDFDGLRGRVVSSEGELTTVDFGDAGVHSVDPVYLRVLQQSSPTADDKLKSHSQRSHSAISSSSHHDVVSTANLKDAKALHSVLASKEPKSHSHEAHTTITMNSKSGHEMHKSKDTHKVHSESGSSHRVHTKRSGSHKSHDKDDHSMDKDVLKAVVDEVANQFGVGKDAIREVTRDLDLDTEALDDTADVPSTDAHADELSEPVPAPEQMLSRHHSQERHLTARASAASQAFGASESQERLTSREAAEWRAAGEVPFPAGVDVGETLQRRLAVTEELKARSSQLESQVLMSRQAGQKPDWLVNITKPVQPFVGGHKPFAGLLQIASEEAEAGSTFLFGGEDDP